MEPAVTPDLCDNVDSLSIFHPKLRLVSVGLLALFLLAGLIRIKDRLAPGILVEREYTSAIFARTFYFEGNSSIEPWRKEIARITRERQPILEPPITEYLVSLMYRIAGREEIWFARLLTSTFWLAGGWFLFLAARRLVPLPAAIFAAGYYLFVPSGVLLSRSFQPDSLMMMMFMISFYLILRYFDTPSTRNLLLAAFISSVTLLIRPLVVFVLFSAFTGLLLYHRKSLKALIERPFILFSLVSLSLPFVYYGYGILFAGFMQWKIASSFRPYLYFRSAFWVDWFFLAVNAVGLPALIAVVLGFPFIRSKPVRVLLLSMFAGYIFFGLFFTFHIHTHDYYHIQLIPIAAFGAYPLVTLFFEQLSRVPGKLKWLAVGAGALLILLFSDLQVRDSLYKQVFEAPDVAREIGEVVNHSQNTVFVAYHYGLPLEYYGELSGTFWPKSITYWFYRMPEEEEKSVQQRLEELEFIPEYFIITNFDEYRRLHQDLDAYLAESCSVLVKTDRYHIFHLCNQAQIGLD